VKLETFPFLPKLLESIVKKAKEAMEEAAKTEQTVREILANQ
jgi:hypothetical protein